MVRTQISLTKQQHAFLKATALEEGVSLSELIRRAVKEMMETPAPSSTVAARSLLGAFVCGAGDVSSRHDEHLSEIYGEVTE